MNRMKAIVAAGTFWLGALGLGQAYIIDWSNPYKGPESNNQRKRVSQYLQMFQNCVPWNRMVGAWQSFVSVDSETINGISICARITNPGSLNLNIYQGVGPGGTLGTLLSSTRLEWDTLPPRWDGIINWYGVKLGQPVTLQKGMSYTIAFEDTLLDDSYAVGFNPEEVEPAGDFLMIQNPIRGLNKDLFNGFYTGDPHLELAYILLK